MIYFNYKIQQKASLFFLIIFLAFLTLSISHSHHFDYVFSPNSKITAENDNFSLDHFLDSSLNCTIHTFNNTLRFDHKFDLRDNYFNFCSAAVILSYNFYYSIITSDSNQLRAPPKYIV